MVSIAKCLDVLRSQVDAAFPGRNKDNDGWIGDARHAATVSDHNPDAAGVVHALDITNDPSKGCVSDDIAKALIASRDPRLKYVISNRRIALGHGENAWKWLPYAGESPHDCHVHVSVVSDTTLCDSAERWKIAVLLPGHADPMHPEVRPGVNTGITATVFGGSDDPNDSAYGGGRIDPNKPGVALPYRFSGQRPLVRVSRGGAAIVCQIVDVGPWNIDDPYWITCARPQAESGKDAFGRATNRAGIDLTPAAARALGVDGKGVVDWEFVSSASAPVPVESKPATPASPQSSPWARLGALIAAMLKKG